MDSDKAVIVPYPYRHYNEGCNNCYSNGCGYNGGCGYGLGSCGGLYGGGSCYGGDCFGYGGYGAGMYGLGNGCNMCGGMGCDYCGYNSGGCYPSYGGCYNNNNNYSSYRSGTY